MVRTTKLWRLWPVGVILLGLIVAPAATQAGIDVKYGEARIELEFWESIKDSDRPEDYEAYLEAYPDGRFAPLARARAKYLRESQKPAEPKPAAPEPKPAAPPPQPPKPSDPAVEPMDAAYRVVRTANLRAKPSITTPSLLVVDPGTQIRVTGRVIGRNWYRAETVKGTVGYIHADLVQQLTTPAPEPTPAPKPKPATKPTPAPAPAPAPARLGEFQDCPNCPEMVALPAGTFTMGDRTGHKSERPAHRVTIGQPFAIGKFEVTVGQWNACVNAGVCASKSAKAGTDPQRPVRDVSWTEAQRYVNWLGKETGQPYRLPTEAEWEYAARAGTGSRYWWGDKFKPGKANCRDCGGEWDRKSPARVGSAAPNPFGLYDLNGSVWEWVADCWHDDFSNAPRDGSVWGRKDCRTRVIRGGSWRQDSSYMHSATRFKYDADVSYLLNGFRVAKSLN